MNPAALTPTPSNPQNQHPLQNQITVPIPTQPQPPTILPSGELIEGNREDYIKIRVPLYEASIKGDWKAAKAILDIKPELVRFAITENYETPLHIAASAQSTKSVEEFVRNLVNLMTAKDLELQNKSDNTALSLAASAGNVETAKIMLEKHKAVLEIPGSQMMLPLYMAALFARAEMVRYLYGISNKMNGDYWTPASRGWVLQKCIEADIFDVAVKIVNDGAVKLVNDAAVKIVNDGGVEVVNDAAVKIENHSPDTPENILLRDVLLLLAQKTDALNEKKSHVVWRIIKSIFHCKVGHAETEPDALQLLKIIWGKVVVMPKRDIDYIIRGPPTKTEEPQQEKTTDKWGVVIEEVTRVTTTDPSGAVVVKNNHKTTTYPPGPVISQQQHKKQPLHLSRALFVATKLGNTRFIIELIRSNPDLIWKTDDQGLTIFHKAVKRRQADIYNLLYEIGSMKDLITPIKDKDGNNMLHLVGKSAKTKRFQSVSGVALQMQRELLWFQEVEQMIPPTYRKRKNKHGEDPHDIFTKNHEKLVERGEVWMKETAAQCMVVATLIATIVFAAAFTLPGGYNQNTGFPMFRPKPSLIVFVITDAIALIFSSTSVLIFLSILTSRYAERDFLESLPKKLMFGLATLFLSIVTMMVAFSASFFLLYHNKQKWLPIMITVFAGIPVGLFAVLQFRLLEDVFYSTYRSRYLFKPKKRTLYY